MAIIKPLFSGYHGGGPFYLRFNSTERDLGSNFVGLYDWATRMQTAMLAALAGTNLVTFDAKFRIKLARSTSWSLNNTATANANAVPVLGFTQTMPLAAVNDAGTYGVATPWGMTATLPILGVFNPELPPQEDNYLETERPNSTTSRSLNGYTISVNEPTLYNRRWRFGFLPRSKTFKTPATAAGDRSLEEFFDTVSTFRFWPDASVPGTYENWVIAQASKQKFQPDRQFTYTALFSQELQGWKL